MQAEYSRQKKYSNTFPVRLLWKLFPHAYISPRFDPLFTDGITHRYLLKNYYAWKMFSAFDPKQALHVGVFSDARGGSHLVESQFHYMRPVFSFSEGFSPSPTGNLNYRAFLLRGTFGVNSLQDKEARDLTHLVYNLNSKPDAEHPFWNPELKAPLNRFWLYNYRNPLRVLHSMAKTGKNKWALTEETAESVSRSFMQRLSMMRRTQDAFPDRVDSLIFEKFVQTPHDEVSRLALSFGVGKEQIANRVTAESFFKAFFRCGSVPKNIDGYLTSPKSGERIKGWGGGFNPIAKIDSSRAFMPSVANVIPENIRSVVESVLGPELMELMMTDGEHLFSNVTTEDLMRYGHI